MKSRILAVAIALAVTATLSVVSGSAAAATATSRQVHPLSWPQCCWSPRWAS